MGAVPRETDYPWIEVWCQIMGSYAYYVRDEKERARAANAPQTTYAANGGEIRDIEEITNLATMRRIEEIAERRGLTIPPHVVVAWGKAREEPK